MQLENTIVLSKATEIEHAHFRAGISAWMGSLSLMLLFPILNTAIYSNSPYFGVSMLLTETAGKYGSLIIIALTAWLYGIRLESKKEQVKSFVLSFLFLLLFLGVFALINEKLTKPLVGKMRPSHFYIFNQTNWPDESIDFYERSSEQRSLILGNLIANNAKKFAGIDPYLLQHWVEESGLSFPSGHSFNAWMLATLLSFSMLRLRSTTWLHKWYFVPFIWSSLVGISRIALGVHTLIDVAAGSLIGLLIASLALYLDSTRKFIFRKRA